MAYGGLFTLEDGILDEYRIPYCGLKTTTLAENDKGRSLRGGSKGLAQRRPGRAIKITNNLSHNSQPTAGC